MYQCGFRKTISSQHCLILMIEKWRHSVDKKGYACALLTFHNLMLAKLNAYGFDYNSNKLIHCYLTNRYQRVKVNCDHSSWTEIINGVPQGLILGPLLFNIYLSGLFIFFQESDLANYADDNTLYAYEKDMGSILLKLEEDSKRLIEWVCYNNLRANPDKFHLLLSSDDPNLLVNVENYNIFNSNYEKLLGVKFDNKLKFNEHVSGHVKKLVRNCMLLSELLAT